MAKKPEIDKVVLDMFLQPLEVGDIVVSRNRGDIMPATIVAFSPKMVKMKKIHTNTYRAADEFYNYSNQIAKMDQQNAMLWLLKKGIPK